MKLYTFTSGVDLDKSNVRLPPSAADETAARLCVTKLNNDSLH